MPKTPPLPVFANADHTMETLVMANFGIHEEIHRMILRKRWINWSVNNYSFGDYAKGGRHVKLSQRLTAWKPNWMQRPENNQTETYDTEKLDRTIDSWRENHAS